MIERDRSRSLKGAAVLLVVVVFLVAVWAAKPYAVGVFHDDGVYAILAKSLATGQGYRYLHLPGAPPATHYPPGYPILLAVLWRIAPNFPGNVRLLLLANAALLALTAWSLERFTRRMLGWNRLASFGVAVIATLSYPLVMLSGLVLSETLFAALLIPIAIIAERVASDETVDRERPRAIFLGCLAGVLALVRTHGIALLLSTLLVLAYRRRWRAAALVTSGAVLMLAPWQLWSGAQPLLAEPLRGSYGSYGGWVAEGVRSGGAKLFFHTIAVNLREVGALLADRFSIGDSSAIRAATAWLCAVVVLIGAWRLLRRAPVIVLFASIYVAVLLAWPFTPWRFVFAIWPLVIVAIAEAVRPAFQSAQSGPTLRWTALSVAVIVGAGLAREESRAYAHRTWRHPGDAATAQIAPLIRWVSRDTKPDDVVAVEGEQLVYLFTGRRAIPLAPFTAAEYMRPPTLGENVSVLSTIVTRFPVAYVATISLPLVDAADSLVATGRLVHLGALAESTPGAAFRVRR